MPGLGLPPKCPVLRERCVCFGVQELQDLTRRSSDSRSTMPEKPSRVILRLYWAYEKRMETTI